MESKTKQDHPQNAATSMLIDHLNAKALMALFNRAKDNDEEGECERLCHAITLHLRMHNQAVAAGLVPMLEKLDGGDKLAAAMTQQITKMEALLAKIDASKKHLANKSFVKFMAQAEKACSAMATTMESTVAQVIEGLEEEDLREVANKMVQAKMDAVLVPAKAK